MHDVRLEKFTKWNLDMPILKTHMSSRPPLILPTDCRNAVRTTGVSTTASDQISKLACSIPNWVVRATADSATASDQASPDNKKPSVFDSALALEGIEFNSLLALAGPAYGVSQAGNQHQFDFTTETCALLTNGRACYENSKRPLQ
jgi:hypothetical protein